MKKAVLHTTTQKHCKARPVLCILLSTNQGGGSEMKFVAGATKSVSKIWKPIYD